MSKEPANLVLETLRAIRTDIARVDEKVDSLRADVGSDIASLRADVASDLLTMRKETSEQIVGLRRAVVDYHSAVLGHGMLTSDLEARVRRMEDHLKLPAMGAE